MLKLFAIISFIFAGIFLLLFLLNLAKPLKKKSLKTRQKILGRRRLYGVALGCFLVAGIILQVAGGKTNVLPKTFISDATPLEAYQQSSAYESLPDAIFATGNDYYIKNGRNEIYGYLALEDEEGALSYQEGLCYEDAVQVAGGKDFIAVRSKKGSLRLLGAFEYLRYEKDSSSFDGEERSKDCSFMDANSNNLFYVEDGTLYSVGYNAFGLLGDGTERNRLEGSAVLENVKSVSVSPTHALIVDIYGNLYGVGDNSYSEMGNRTTAHSPTPTKLMSGVKEAKAGKYFSVVLTKDGDVYTAGRNHLGQLGTGDDRDYATYMKVLEGISKISVSNYSCAALTADGDLYAWGDNEHKQLGIGREQLNKPQKVAEEVYDAAMGEQSMGLIFMNRDVAVTGAARKNQDKSYIQVLYELDGEVPADQYYRETVEMPSRQDD